MLRVHISQQLFRRSARRILFLPVMRFDDFDIKIIVQRLRRHPRQPAKHRHARGKVVRPNDGDFPARFADGFALLFAQPRRADDQRNLLRHGARQQTFEIAGI